MDIYQIHIMDHYRNPRNKGVCSNATFTSDVVNPSCGDAVTISGIIDNGIITRLCFEGHGCVISQAAASMLTEKVHGKLVQEALALQSSDMLQLVGIMLGPTRARCALLALEALHKGIVHNA